MTKAVKPESNPVAAARPPGAQFITGELFPLPVSRSTVVRKSITGSIGTCQTVYCCSC